MIIRVAGAYSHIECDVPGCGERSPPASVMIEKHGLTGCGWYVGTKPPNLGKHRCPEHHDADVPAPGPQERSAREQKRLDALREKSDGKAA